MYSQYKHSINYQELTKLLSSAKLQEGEGLSKPHLVVKLGVSKRFLRSKFINLLSASEQKEAMFCKGEQSLQCRTAFKLCKDYTLHLRVYFLIIIPLDFVFYQTKNIRCCTFCPWQILYQQVQDLLPARDSVARPKDSAG